HCLNEPFAPFPAILYCFSTIEMMGALVEGEASIPPPSKTYVDPCDGKTKPMGANGASANYMRQYMSYTDEQTCLLMQIFRHKLSHLAQPRPVIKRGGKKIAWQYEHENRDKHLLTESA